MLTSLGDSPELRLEFGSAYATAGFAERGIPEFEKALAMNEKIRGGHYSLGAAYVSGLGNVLQDKAEAEFRKELANYPDDPLSLYQLGSIELSRHDEVPAEKDLATVAKLDPKNPDPFLLLGQLYLDTQRPKEAEAALRKCIALTAHVERNHFQVQRAHYLLARILNESGRGDEAKAEMKIANDLLKRNTLSMQGVTEPSPTESANAVPSDPSKQREADEFEQKIKRPVADSYNNLGAIEASANRLPAALRYFQMAARWNPSLEGLDYNWGRAAFLSGDYKQAFGPLGRWLALHPDDAWVRSALGSAQFSLQDYPDAVKTLQPMERLLGGKPQLNYIYAVSLLKSGQINAAVERLEGLEKANPEIAVIPEALSEAYAGEGENEKAARQKEIAREIRARESSQKHPRPN